MLPILCGQYHRRKIDPAADCHYHFVSAQMADTKTALKPGTYGPLYSLKTLLEAEHNYGLLEQQEIDLLNQMEAVILPRIQEILHDKHNDDVSIDEARDLLPKTWIETDHPTLRRHFNLEVLETALEEAYPLPDVFRAIVFLPGLEARQMVGRGGVDRRDHPAHLGVAKRSPCVGRLLPRSSPAASGSPCSAAQEVCPVVVFGVRHWCLTAAVRLPRHRARPDDS